MPAQELQTSQPARRAAKPYKGMAMEGPIARWYTNIRGQDEEAGVVVRQVSATLPPGSRVLEVAPGPGYLAIELARLGKYRVVGLDISKSFVQIACAKARQAGVSVDFQQGNASDMPFEAASFDLIICRAAFKNFTEPVRAIREMYRVLKPGGRALIMDLRRDASLDDINAHIRGMGLGRLNAFMTRWTFRRFLLKNAYTPEDMRSMAAQTDFARVDIRKDAIGMEVSLEK
jgi:ubiquinone/menaquinone biosynthesis C-methylase UbiE